MANQVPNETKTLDRLLDVNKQMMTLSAGATVLIATFLKDLFPPNAAFYAKLLAGGAFLLFFGSIVSSIAAMLATTSSGLGTLGPANEDKAASYTRVAHRLFVLAVIVFATTAYAIVVTR